MDIDDIIAIVQEYFPSWELPEDLCLDAETIYRLSSVIKFQGDWLKYRSTSLYADPFLIEDKLRRLNKEELVTMFLNAWHPIIELEQISPRSLEEAIKYWRNLLPLSERWQKIEATQVETETTTREEMIRQRILDDIAFSERLEAFWEELKQKVGRVGKIRYWDFVGADTYPETVRRAYFAAFLITYGYATLEIHRLEEEIFMIPFKKPKSLLGKKQVVSVPISISVEEWEKWKKGEHSPWDASQYPT